MCVLEEAGGFIGPFNAYLGHVEDLDTMIDGFATDDHVVFVCSDLTPEGERGLLRKTSQVDKFALGRDFGKGGSISLSNGNKFAAIVRNPSPGRGAVSDKATEILMASIIEEVDLKRSVF